MAKERVSLTLDEELVAALDERFERRGITNRSQGMEALLRDHLKGESVTTAVVLAGGAEPNALIPINGRPVLDHILDHLADEGVDTVYVATSAPDILDQLGDHDLNLQVVVEDEPQGTAGALRGVREQVGGTVLVVNGDVLCQVDVGDMRHAHEESGADATIALTTVGDAGNYGVIRMKGNQVVGFQEKPDESISKLINAGIYLLEPGFLDRIPGREEQEQVDIEELFEQLAAEERINGYVYDGEWREVG